VHASHGEGSAMTAAAHSEWVLILDYGSQYTQLIARRIRECRVYCEIHPASGYDVASQKHGGDGAFYLFLRRI
jgi:hypothetical protein